MHSGRARTTFGHRDDDHGDRLDKKGDEVAHVAAFRLLFLHHVGGQTETNDQADECENSSTHADVTDVQSELRQFRLQNR